MEGGTMNAAAFNAPLLVVRSTLLLRGMISHLEREGVGREGSVHSPRFPASNSGFRSLPLPLRINPAPAPPHKSTRRRLYCSISSHVSGLRKWRLLRSPPFLLPLYRPADRPNVIQVDMDRGGQYQIVGRIDGQTSLKYSLSAALR